MPELAAQRSLGLARAIPRCATGAATGARRRRRRRFNSDIFVHAAAAFGTFFSFLADGNDALGGNATQEMSANSDESDDHMDAGSADNAEDVRDVPSDDAYPAGMAAGVPVAEPTASSSSKWDARTGPCSPALSTMPKSDFMGWSAVRTFLLAVLGDPVVGMFPEDSIAPLRGLAAHLQAETSTACLDNSAAADTVGFVSNFLTRADEHLKANGVLRRGVGRGLEFIVAIEDVVDAKFAEAAKKAAGQDTGLNKVYCDQWGEQPNGADFKRFAAKNAVFANRDLEIVYKCFENFGNLPRVRPAIFAEKAKRKKRRAAERTRVAARRRGTNQADEEDENDRCNKAFPKHPDLMAGVFDVVCPHVVTLGLRVMFDAESVGEALSVLLERFPKLPKVVFYDVGCKLDRNAMRRVRTIFKKHKVKVVIDRVHAKGYTCSPIFFPNEALGLTNGVATQAAEVQLSVSAKFRSHLAYMSPESFMAHRIVQLSLMNLNAAYKHEHPLAKEVNEDACISDYFHTYVSRECSRSAYCPCPASRQVVVYGEQQQTL